MEISIVMAYYNRIKQFRKTLESITYSKIKDIEVIVVDDGSDDEHRLESLVIDFPFLKIIRLERKDRRYTNPSIPFNIGIKEARGNIIMLQNPECFHSDDILLYVVEQMNENDYFSFSAYALTNEQTNRIINLKNNILEEAKKIVMPYNSSVFNQQGVAGWYNHTLYRPAAYHFCSAMFNIKMLELNGFDERYANGVDYDDDELVVRIKRNKMNIKIIDDVTVYHQAHESVSYQYFNTHQLRERNKNLLYNVTMRENVVFVNKDSIFK